MRDTSQLDPLFQAAADKYGIDPTLLKAVGLQESGLNVGTRDSNQGAQGLMQMLPATAASMGASNPRDPAQAIDAAARYLREGYDKTGSPEGAVMYYHGGPDQRIWGPKTQAYVQSVGANYASMRQKNAPAAVPSADPAVIGMPPNVDELVRKYGGGSPAAAVPNTAPSTDLPPGINVDDLVKKYGAPAGSTAPAPVQAVPAVPAAPVIPPQAPRVVTDAQGNETPAAPLTAADVAAIKANPQALPLDRITNVADARRAVGEVNQYVGNQLMAVPQAVAYNYKAGTGLASSGATDIAYGRNALPSFPSADPSTWQPGGVLKIGSGLAAAAFSPASGIANKLVQEPITAATGSPMAGEVAGAVATGGLGNAAMGALGKAVGGAGVDAETLRLANVADKNGIPIRASQISTNPFVQKLDQAAGWIPGSGRQGENAAQQSAFTRSVAKTFGEDTDQITRTTVANAQKRIGGVLNDIEARTPIQFDNTVINQLGKVESDAARAFTPDSPQYKQIKNQVDQIVNVAAQHNGVVPGDVWANFSHYKSPLSRLADSADSDVGNLAGEIKSAMQDAVQRNAAPGDGAAYTNARYQYKNLKTVEPLVTKGTPGEISPLGLNQRVNAKFGTTNAGELGDLADAAQRFLRPPRDSGTPLGNLAVNALMYPGTAIGAAIGGAGYAGLPIQAMAGYGATAGLGALASRGVSMALNNPIYRNMLLNGSSTPGAVNKLINGALANAPAPELQRK